MQENDKKVIHGVLFMARVDGSAEYISEMTRDRAVEEIEMMKSIHPKCYEISGSNSLDGSIDLTFKSKSPVLNNLVVKFTPNEIR